MLKKRSKLLSVFLVLCFVITLFPFQTLAFIDTDNIGTPAKINEKGNLEGGDTFSREPVLSAFTLIGYWDVIYKNTGEKLGKASVLYLDKESAKSLGMEPGCYTMVAPNTWETWTEAFKGNLDFVRSKIEPKNYPLKRDSDGKYFDRYWLRDIAYASGAYINPDMDKKVVYASISWNPAAIFDEMPDPIIAGEEIEIGIYAESSVLYRQEGGYPGVSWELQVDGEKIADGSTENMTTKKFEKIPYTFCCEGEYTLSLIATDRVGRTTRNEITVFVEPGEEETEIPEGDPNLKLTIVSQDRKTTRPENTAKWTDWILAEFDAPSAPSLSPCYRLETWELVEATLVYPKKAKNFTFGNPIPPEGTMRVPMKIDKDNNTATLEIQEDWSMNGAFVYNMLTKEMIPGPTRYPITVEYEIKWEYEKGERKCSTNSEGKRKCRCTNYESHSKTRSGTATVQLLVNGTGVDSRAQ